MAEAAVPKTKCCIKAPTFEYNEHKDTISDQLAQLLSSTQYSDVVFSIGEQKLSCHKTILASRCSYFEKMFSFESTDITNIPITTMPYEIFHAIITFIYTGKVTFLQTKDFAELLLQNADMMGLEDLQEVIKDYYMSIINPENCLGFYCLAKTHNALFMEIYVFQYALEHFYSVVKTEEFLSMPLDVIQQYLGRYNVNAVSEEDICSAAMEWVMYKAEERVNQLTDVLCELRLTDLSAHFIKSNLLLHPGVKQNKEAIQLLEDVLQHIWLLKPIPLMIKSAFPRTNTNMVTGLAIIGPSSSNQSEGYINLLAFEKGYILGLIKGFDSCKSHRSHNSTVCDNSVIASEYSGDYRTSSYYGTANVSNRGIKKYEVATNKWIPIRNFSVNDNTYIFPVAGDVKELYGVVYKCHNKSYQQEKNDEIVISSIMRYSFYENMWTELVNFTVQNIDIHSSETNVTVFAFKQYLYICGISIQDHAQEQRTAIAAVNILSKKCAILKSHLPEVFSSIHSIIYRDHVIISGTKQVIIYNLSSLERDADQQMEIDTHISKQDFDADANSEHRSVNEIEESTSCGNDTQILQEHSEGFLKEGYIRPHLQSKLGEHKLARVGNQLLALQTDTRYTSVFTVNIDHFITNKEDLEWKIVCRLPFTYYHLTNIVVETVRFCQVN